MTLAIYDDLQRADEIQAKMVKVLKVRVIRIQAYSTDVENKYRGGTANATTSS